MENVSVGNPSVGTGNCGYVKPSRQYKGLVVDDEEVICEMLQDMVSGVGTVYFLDKLNVRVIHTINGCNAKAIASEHSDTDVLITDIRMPGNSGPELYREFMSLPSKRMGVVFISGYNNGHIIPDGSAFLQKPFMSKNVADAINIEIRKLEGLEGRVN